MNVRGTPPHPNTRQSVVLIASQSRLIRCPHEDRRRESTSSSGPPGSSASASAPVHDHVQQASQPTNRVTKLQLAVALFNWVVWLLLVVLALSQFLSVFWSTVTMNSSNDFGQSPLKGAGSISGVNDEPYSDRSLVWILQGLSYLPATINGALLLGTTKIVDTAGTSINGYRVGKQVVSVLNSDAIAMYTHTCSVVAATLDVFFKRCTLLGYNVTRNHLRIVDDLESTTTYLIGNSLPTLIMPFWDNSLTGRFVISGSDGSACMFRLVGKYSEVKSAIPYLIAVNRTARETKTGAWLKRPGGKWRNGWYEDPDGAKWHSDMISNEKGSTLGIPLSQFNMLMGEELVCDDLMKCAAVFLDNCGSKFSSARRVIARTSIIVSNGKRYGFFQYHAHLVNTTTSIYG